MVLADAAGLSTLLRRSHAGADAAPGDLAQRIKLTARALDGLELPDYARLDGPTTGEVGLDPSGLDRCELAADAVPVPLPPTPLLGRSDELHAASDLLLSNDVRLLTLSGPAGVGKTRLALEIARVLQGRFADGIWFVALASIRDPDLVLPTIAHHLTVCQIGQRSPLGSLHLALRDRRPLLILDNFEQVLGAAPHLADLLAASPGLKLLVTSRARLRLRWEHLLTLAPLALPAPDPALQPVASLAATPAVALFVERARASNPGFALTSENAAAVAALVTHLEGLPLGIELAAAHANVLAPAEMLGWVERRLPVLDSDAPDLPARQRSLRGALAWSYALLPPAEQALFRQLAVFSGGWTREAAGAVCRSEEPGLDIVAGLGGLVDASIVQTTEQPDGQLRFSLLETVRELAFGELEAHGERAAALDRHARYYASLAEDAARALDGLEQRTWATLLDREHGNSRAALEWAAQSGDAATTLRLAGSLAHTRAERGAHTYSTLTAEGGTMTPGYVASTTLDALALRPAAPTTTRALPPIAPANRHELLSPREHEVLRLVADGATNRQISEALVISHATARFHVASLLNKLGADNRTHAVALARERGVL